MSKVPQLTCNALIRAFSWPGMVQAVVNDVPNRCCPCTGCENPRVCCACVCVFVCVLSVCVCVGGWVYTARLLASSCSGKYLLSYMSLYFLLDMDCNVNIQPMNWNYNPSTNVRLQTHPYTQAYTHIRTHTHTSCSYIRNVCSRREHKKPESRC